jgi:hypothetical protein
MNQPNTELEAWLSGVDLFEPASNDLEDWVAGFDADRQLVVFKLGPFKRLFLRPETFQKRFYHQIYPLAIQSWPYRRQIQLFDDFCTLDIELNIRFQATLAYAQKNSEILEMLNQHIQQVYTAVIEDRINQELSHLADGVWVQKGLSNHEKRLAVSVCEILTLQHIQAEALCHMSASFAEFPEVQLGKDSVYLHVLKKTFETHQQKQAELERQQVLAQQQTLLAKQAELEHLKQLAEMQRQIQLQEAEAQLQLLEDKEQQIARQRDVERRIHAEQINHEQQLKEISLEIELRGQQELESRQRLAETQLTTDRLAHQTFLTEKQTIAEIERQAMIQRRRREANQLEADDYDVRTDE